MTDKKDRYFYGTGRRKTAVARVRLYAGKGQFTVNTKEVVVQDDLVIMPLETVGELGKWDLRVLVSGGGKQSQREAIRLGVARALVAYQPELRQALKKAGYLKRDPREKERKKPGLRGARRAPQWSKR